MFCPKCGTTINESDMFCRSCGAGLAAGTPQLELRGGRSLPRPAVWGIGATVGLLVLTGILWGIVSRARHAQRDYSAQKQTLGHHAATPARQHGVRAPLATASNPAEQQAPPAEGSKRIDPPGEAPGARIAKILRETTVFSVSCGGNADPDVCRFLVNALATYLSPDRVKVLLYHDDDPVADQSFYAPVFPYSNVSLRLIEVEGQQATSEYLGGFCFDPHAHNMNGLQLPVWVQVEKGGTVGPLEEDKVAAAKVLARTFAAYWEGLVAPLENQPNMAALHWAAQQGDHRAQTYLGFLYYNGKEGLSQDFSQAEYWWWQAAGWGNAAAQYDLAVMYAKGQAKPADAKEGYEEAYVLLLLAAQGKAQAATQQDILKLLKLVRSQLPADTRTAAAIYVASLAAQEHTKNPEDALRLSGPAVLGLWRAYPGSQR